MTTRIIITMSEDYFHSLLNSGSHKDLSQEEFQFWQLGDDLMPHTSQIYSLQHFYGAEAGGGPDLPALLIEIGPAVLTSVAAIVPYLIEYLKRNQNRELHIKHGDDETIIKGHSLPEEKELLHILIPKSPEDEIVKTNHSD